MLSGEASTTGAIVPERQVKSKLRAIIGTAVVAAALLVASDTLAAEASAAMQPGHAGLSSTSMPCAMAHGQGVAQAPCSCTHASTEAQKPQVEERGWDWTGYRNG